MSNTYDTTNTSQIDVPTSMVLNELIQFCSREPRDMTYFGIGSAPHMLVDQIAKSRKWDQIIPEFMVDIINRTDKTIRIIHFDPQFSRKDDFLNEYFKKYQKRTFGLNFTLDASEGLNVWKTDDHRIEVFIIAKPFNHLERHYGNEEVHDDFLHEFNEMTIASGNQLIVQEYTGHELGQLTKSLYDKSSNKDIFKKKILYDVSYGNDCHCGTDLERYKPIYNDYGDFYNLTLFNSDEMKEHIGKDPTMDKILKLNFIKQFNTALNIHVDYRRRLQNLGENLVRHHRYNNSSSADEIMSVLQDELTKCISILDRLQMITPNKINFIDCLFKNYKVIHMYKWYEFAKLVGIDDDITSVKLAELYASVEK
jgi:hypothetical protein